MKTITYYTLVTLLVITLIPFGIIYGISVIIVEGLCKLMDKLSDWKWRNPQPSPEPNRRYGEDPKPSPNKEEQELIYQWRDFKSKTRQR